MFNSKKGVSEVVANVLIVLLVIVGIAVIWSVVKPTIDRSAESINADCFTLSVEPVSCVSAGSAGLWDVTVKRNSGTGSFDNLEIVFSDGTNSASWSANPVVTSAGTASLNELSTRTITSADDGSITATTGVTANVAVRSNGQLCPVTTQPINCA